MDKKTCPQCNKSFARPPKMSPARWGKSINCSVACQRKSYTKKVLVNCFFCKKEYSMHNYRLKTYKKHFCSAVCKGKEKQSAELYKYGGFPKGHATWNKGKTWPEEFVNKMSLRMKGKLVGANNPAWKGGITKLSNKIRRLSEYKEWLKAVFKRDKYTCRKCLKFSGRLTSQHLKGFTYILQKNNIQTIEEAIKCKELWETENGVTLCFACHEQTPNYTFRAVKNPIDLTVYQPII